MDCLLTGLDKLWQKITLVKKIMTLSALWPLYTVNVHSIQGQKTLGMYINVFYNKIFFFLAYTSIYNIIS